MKVELLFLLLLPGGLMAQTNITVKDAAEISYKSELLVSELKDLMNVISNKETNLKETKDLIYNSHSGSKNKIFYGPTILVEDDLTPGPPAATPKEVTIEKYLNDLDVLYQKSDTFSINFENIRVSKVKQADYLYIKVYFNSIFSNKSVATTTPYPVNNRLAEVRLDKANNKWQMQIMRLGYFNPADTVNDIKNDVAINYGDTTGGKSPTGINVATLEEELKAQVRANVLKEDEIKRADYQKLINQGDQFMGKADYANALKAFTDAQELYAYERYPKIKIMQINKLVDDASVSNEDLYKQYIQKAQIAEKERNYEQAKEFYSFAVAKKPMESAAIEQNIRVLTAKLRTITEPEEKYRAGQYKDAIKDYEKAIKKDAKNSDLFLGRGKCYDKTGESGRALKDYTTAIELDNNNLQALQLRAEIYAAKKDPFKALTDYKIYTTINKTDPNAFFRMSELHVIANNQKDAVEDLDKVIAFDPKNAKAYYRKGLLLYQQKNSKEAFNNFSTAIKADVAYPQSYYQRGLINIDMGSIPQAGEDFASARRYGLDSVSLQKVSTIAWNYYSRGLDHFNRQSPDSAIRLFNTAIIIDPYVAEYRYRRGEYFYNLKKYDSAITNYTDAIQLNKNYYEALFKRGLSKFNKQAYENAIPDFEAAIKVSPQAPITYKRLADAQFMLQQFAPAIARYDQTLQVAKNNKVPLDPAVLADLYNNQGKSYFNTNDYNRALECFKNAVKADKNMAEAWFNRGNTYLRLGQLGEAEADIVKALSFQSDIAYWHFTLGEVYRLKQEYPNAVRYYTQAITADKGGKIASNAIYGRGVSYYQQADFIHALPDYNSSSKNISAENMRNFQVELGTIYLQLGKSDSAQQAFNHVLAGDSLNVNAQYGVGTALVQKNQFAQAMPWFEKAFRSGSIKYNTVKKDKLIAAIKEDKQFKALVKKYF